MEKVAQAVPADQQSCGEVSQDEKAEHDIERFDPPCISCERRGDDEDHSHDIERQQPVAEAVGGTAVRLIPIAQPLDHQSLLRQTRWGPNVERCKSQAASQHSKDPQANDGLNQTSAG
jgi:hypothetical protein